MYFQLDEMIFQSPEPRFPEFASADYYQSLVCLTIGKQSLPIRVLHTVRHTVSSFH